MAQQPTVTVDVRFRDHISLFLMGIATAVVRAAQLPDNGERLHTLDQLAQQINNELRPLRTEDFVTTTQSKPGEADCPSYMTDLTWVRQRQGSRPMIIRDDGVGVYFGKWSRAGHYPLTAAQYGTDKRIIWEVYGQRLLVPLHPDTFWQLALDLGIYK